MKRVSLAVACVLGLWSAEASAQMPPGSYAQSCRDIRFDGRTLSALCAGAQGMEQRSALRTDTCSGPIANLNGQLVCPGGGRGGPPQPQPQGPAYGGGGPQYQGGYERGYGRRYDRDDDDDDRRYRGGPAYGGYPQERPPGGYGPPPGSGYGPPPGPGYGQPPGYARPQGPPPAPPQAPPPQQAAPGAGFPPGSWQASCVKPVMQGTTLIAACRNGQGGYTQSTIDARSCRAIANMNGRLVCGG